MLHQLLIDPEFKVLGFVIGWTALFGVVLYFTEGR